MTISSQSRIAGPYAGNGVAASFAFSFKVFAAVDLLVLRTETTGGDTTLALTTDYTVALNADQDANPGGNVTLVAGALATGLNLTITSNIATLQPTDLTNQGGFYPRVISNALDRLTILLQQQLAKLNRAITMPLSGPESGASVPAEGRSNTLLGFDALGALKLYAVQLGTSLVDLAASAGASLVGFTQGVLGALTMTVQAKLRQDLSVNDFAGVDPTGALDSTVGLKAAFDYAIPIGKLLKMKGNYRITGPIQPYVTRESGGLHIFVEGRVQILVDPASAAFSDVLCFQTNLYNSCTILGGELNINGSNKAARGITIRHNDASGGDVLITAKLKLTNFLENGAAVTRENSALEIYGEYGSVRVDSPYVYSVNRAHLTLGACAGIAVGNCSGNVEINNPWMELILCGPSGVADGDGIKSFGRNPSVATEEYVGTTTINGGNFVNCQGRSVKSRGTSVTILRPRVRRTSAVVAIPQCVEFDFQACVNASLIDPSYEYFGTDTVAPFGPGTSASCVAFQQTVTNIDSVARNIGGKIVSNVSFPRYAALNTAAGARTAYAEISDVKAIPSGSLTTTMLTRGIAEFDAAVVNSKAAATKYVVNDNQFPLVNVPALGYTGLGSSISISQFSWEVCNNKNSINSTYGRVLRNISGSDIRSVAGFAVYGNQRFKTLGPFTSFEFTQAAPGSSFMVDLTASLSVTNAPAWGSTGYALVEILDGWDSGSLTAARVTVNFGEKPSERFYTYNSGGTWTTDCLPVRSNANIAAIGNAINTQNKVAGLAVFDSTNGRIYVATGSTAAASWYLADGSGTIFPT